MPRRKSPVKTGLDVMDPRMRKLHVKLSLLRLVKTLTLRKAQQAPRMTVFTVITIIFTMT